MQGGSSSIARSPAPASGSIQGSSSILHGTGGWAACWPSRYCPPPDIVSLFAVTKLLASLPIGHILTTTLILVHVRPRPSSIASLTARGPRHHQTSSACHLCQSRRQCHQTAAILRLATVAVPCQLVPIPRLVLPRLSHYVTFHRVGRLLSSAKRSPALLF